MRPTIPSLIASIGYCCPWAFFNFFRKTGDIANRLGVAPQNVRVAKKKVREGVWKCERCERCMKEQVRTAKLIGAETLSAGRVVRIDSAVDLLPLRHLPTKETLPPVAVVVTRTTGERKDDPEKD